MRNLVYKAYISNACDWNTAISRLTEIGMTALDADAFLVSRLKDARQYKHPYLS